MSRFARTLTAVGCCLFVLPGCLARQVARDGRDLRGAIQDLYTDQVMDNLIRAYEGLPFVQLAYHDLVVQDANSLTASAMSDTMVQDLKTTGPLGVLVS